MAPVLIVLPSGALDQVGEVVPLHHSSLSRRLLAEPEITPKSMCHQLQLPRVQLKGELESPIWGAAVTKLRPVTHQQDCMST